MADILDWNYQNFVQLEDVYELEPLGQWSAENYVACGNARLQEIKRNLNMFLNNI